MRLIDVGVLKEWVDNWFTKNRFYHPYAKNNNIPIPELYDIIEQMPSARSSPCEFCKHNDISDDAACLRCTAERKTDEAD